MASRIASRRLFSTTVRRFQEHEKQELKKESKRNPETLVRHNYRASHAWDEAAKDIRNRQLTVSLQILGGVMVAALTGAGFYFGTPAIIHRPKHTR